MSERMGGQSLPAPPNSQVNGVGISLRACLKGATGSGGARQLTTRTEKTMSPRSQMQKALCHLCLSWADM